MANVVVEESVFKRMWEGVKARASEWNGRRPEGEAEAIEMYQGGHKAQGILGFAGAQAPVLAPLLIGAVIYAVVTSEWFSKIEFLNKYWWIKPLGVFGAGYYLFRKRSPWAQAVLAASAIMFVKAWKERPEAAKDAKAKETSGVDDEDAGRWEWDSREDWRDREDWRASRDAREADRRARYLGEGRASPAERLADRLFEHARAA